MVEEIFQSDWPDFLIPSIPHKYLHALGAVSVAWNALDQAMESLLQAELGLDFETGPIITTHMGNKLLTDILVALSEKQNSAEIHAAILYGVKLFEATRENRNTLAHWMQAFVHGDAMYVERVTVHRKKKRLVALLPLAEIRRVAEEISSANAYIDGITCHLKGFSWDKSDSPRLSLPPKSHLPSKLNWRSQ